MKTLAVMFLPNTCTYSIHYVRCKEVNVTRTKVFVGEFDDTIENVKQACIEDAREKGDTNAKVRICACARS